MIFGIRLQAVLQDTLPVNLFIESFASPQLQISMYQIGKEICWCKSQDGRQTDGVAMAIQTKGKERSHQHQACHLQSLLGYMYVTLWVSEDS